MTKNNEHTSPTFLHSNVRKFTHSITDVEALGMCSAVDN